MNLTDLQKTNENVVNTEELENGYETVLKNLREKLISLYGQEVLSHIGQKNQKNILKSYIQSVVLKNFENYNSETYLERFYQDIFGLVFIEQYLNRSDFEEMNGNAYNDIEIVLKGGTYKIAETFQSPEHAINILRKMALMGGATLDEANPIRDSFIGTGLRLTVSIYPIVDKEVGATFSLRKLKDNEITADDLVNKYNSYSREEIDFLVMCLEHGVSVLFGGATSSGKTSDMQTILYEIAKKGKKRIYTIEENTRELNLIVKNGKKVISRTIHNKTRPSSNKNTLNVDSSSLVKTALRYHPDIICPAEVRGAEAKDSVEAALTGHTVTSSAHVLSVTKAYKRLFGLCKKSENSANDDFVMEDLVTAYPICVFKKQLSEDSSRRCLKIFEATGYDPVTKKIKGNILFKFFKKVTRVENEEKVTGKHKQVNKISRKLCQTLFDNGCPPDDIRKYNSDFNENDKNDYIEDYIPENQNYDIDDINDIEDINDINDIENLTDNADNNAENNDEKNKDNTTSTPYDTQNNTQNEQDEQDEQNTDITETEQAV